MRIGIVTSSYPVLNNPYAGNFVQNQVRALADLGARCTVFRPGPAEFDAAREPAERLVQIAVEKNGPGSFLTTGFPEAFTKRPWTASWHLFRLMVNATASIRGHAPDLDWILAHWAVPSGLSCLAALRTIRAKRRPRLAVWCHSSDVYALERIPDGGMVGRALFSSADRVWVVSEDLQRRLVRLTELPADTFEVLHPGVSLGPAPLPAPPGPLRAVFVGRLEDIKGVHHIIDVFCRRSDLRLSIVGTGSRQEQLVNRARDAVNIDFMGAVAPEQIRPILDAHNVLLLPGAAGTEAVRRTEGLPTVLLEAFAAGRPVVAGDQGGVAEIVDDRVGFLTPPGDERAIEDALHVLDNRDDLRRAMGENARERAEQYNFRTVSRRILEQFS